MTEEERHWLEEYIKTTKNLCDIAILVMRGNQEYLLPTVLELLYIETQSIVDDYCIKE